MGWIELQWWRKEMNRQLRVRAGAKQADPESWQGQEGDGFWEQMNEERSRRRGR